VDPDQAGVAAEFPGVALAAQGKGFGEVQTALASLARQDGSAAKAINDIIDSRLRLEGIGRGFLAIGGKLQAQVTGGAKSRALVSDSTALSVATRSSPFSLMAKLVTGLAGSKKTLFSPE